MKCVVHSKVYRCSRFPSWHRKWWCVTVPSCSRRNGVIWFSFEMTVIKLIRLAIICGVHTLLRNQIMSQDTDARKVNRHSLKGKDSHDKKRNLLYIHDSTTDSTSRLDTPAQGTMNMHGPLEKPLTCGGRFLSNFDTTTLLFLFLYSHSASVIVLAQPISQCLGLNGHCLIYDAALTHEQELGHSIFLTYEKTEWPSSCLGKGVLFLFLFFCL